MAVFYNAVNVLFPKIKRRITTKWIHLMIEKHHKKAGAVTCIFCSDAEILRINRQYLNHDYYTDIITFDYTENGRVSGDLFISTDTVRSNAEKFGTIYEEELLRVIIHGVLHLCGFKDKTPEDKKIMREKENEALEKVNELTSKQVNEKRAIPVNPSTRQLVNSTTTQQQPVSNSTATRQFPYDIIVVGAGHAGCEAAAAAANLGSKTLLITMDMNKIAQMSCNPAVGGIAKGQIVREIDALGGQMGIVADMTAIQFRMLNRSKGPAMWSPRAQSDRMRYTQKWRETLDAIPNLFIWQDSVTQLLVENNAIVGVQTALDTVFRAKAVILTAGTFLNGLIHVGKTQMSGGRISEPASPGITEQLIGLGFKAGRMKTGTPVRIDGRSVDFSLTGEQAGENGFHKFSYLDFSPRPLKQLSCWILYTNEAVHEVLRKGLPDSPLYNGQIKSVGPRYCPSIETKIVTFADKMQHQLFLEPEGENTQEYYLNGFSSSLPLQIQLEALRQIPALRDVQIYRPGYAIEYDFFPPDQLHPTLETKRIGNLFFAGQINGTTGYEEAAAQGLMAGVNAHINVHGGSPFTLARDEAYIGVLIDDLVTKGVDEPYRMFTSRAEYRILLRQDDADVRLTEKSHRLGLAGSNRLELLREKKEEIERIVSFVRNCSVKPEPVNPALEAFGATPLRHSVKLVDLILRPQLNMEKLAAVVPALREYLELIPNRKEEIIEAAEILIKYEGYIAREKIIAEKINRLENIKIRGKFDYNAIQSLSTEAKQKLTRTNPETIAQASRIPGVSPSDINVLLVLLGR
ncbi:MAG: tRNA uridine-5-carboxymethylaminomethyl(34) synthesis enzyme MnmG [Dysgonamonadaceae bacterium]|jgi:tRNA uridine 5-carboxymethylaminomethyl modification enzyme|nr:tRNA uridine-5-carboxymethylaminomethyl(34) synthesis enzyme MnmG [Dysgonamonadaceae bacterium]